MYVLHIFEQLKNMQFVNKINIIIKIHTFTYLSKRAVLFGTTISTIRFTSKIVLISILNFQKTLFTKFTDVQKKISCY